MFVVEQVVSGENVEHEIGRSFEKVIRRAGIALLQLAVVHHHNDARTEPRGVIQLDRRVYATVQTGREQPVVVDTHCNIGQQSRLTNIELTEHRSASSGITCLYS